MRHYTSKVQEPNCFMLKPGPEGLGTRAGLSELNKYLDGNTPASITVRAEFEEWCQELQLANNFHKRPPNGAFFYANVNTGESVLIVAQFGYKEPALNMLGSS